jgi:hypothetical protein
MVSLLKVEGQTIQQIGYFPVNGICALTSKPNFLLLGNGNIVNISNPASPSLTGMISLNGFSTSVLTDGNYAYYGTGMTGKFIIADISNPEFPIQVSSRLFPSITGGIFGMAKKNDVIFLAAAADGVFSVDISNPSKPAVLDSIAIPDGQARDIVTLGDYAYAAHNDGLKIIDISNPAKMSVVSTIGSGYNSIALDSANKLIFLGKNSGGIDAFNLSEPTSPSPAFAIPNSGQTAWDLICRDSHLYLATDVAGLYLYKYDKISATEKAHFPNSGNGQSFAVSLQDSLILLSGLINGVAILKYDSLGVEGINEIDVPNRITISPNPAKSYFEYNLNNETVIEIDILNCNGSSVMKQNCTRPQNRIDISQLPKGLYLVSFKNKQRSWQKKLIKAE